MSEENLSVPADEPVDAAQGAVTDDAPPPWGDDFDPNRAWKTITHLRDREKELERAAKEYERLTSDEDAFKTLGAEKFGYDFAADEDDVEDFDTDPTAAELAAVKQQLEDLTKWRDQELTTRQEQAFQNHLGQLAEAAEVELEDTDKEWIALHASRADGGVNPQNVEAAFNALRARFEAQEQAAIERLKQGKKRAPHVANAGTPATVTEDLDDPQTRVRWMVERMQGGGSQT